MSGGGYREDWPDWLAAKVSAAVRRDPPAWLAVALTGGHRASAADKRAAYERFAAVRNAAARSSPARGAVFASMRGPDDMSPMSRRIFGGG